MVADGQYASKGDVIFHWCRATPSQCGSRFSYRQFGDVRPGTPVSFQIAGETDRTGKIVSSTS